MIRVFDTYSGELLQELRRGMDRAEIFSIAFNANSTFLACSSCKGTVHIFSLLGGQGGEAGGGGGGATPVSASASGAGAGAGARPARSGSYDASAGEKGGSGGGGGGGGEGEVKNTTSGCVFFF